MPMKVHLQHNNYMHSQSYSTCMNYLVVVHDSVERLNPHWVNVSIQHNPLWVVIGEVGHVSHDGGEQAVLPLSCGWVDEAKQLICGDGLGVDVLPDWFQLQVVVGPVQGAQDLWERKSRRRERVGGREGRRGRKKEEEVGGIKVTIHHHTSTYGCTCKCTTQSTVLYDCACTCKYMFLYMYPTKLCMYILVTECRGTDVQ